tara:strand:- start:1327 stop:2163 length:837 start_codon:yes stop_codon:yes gene_type:complete
MKNILSLILFLPLFNYAQVVSPQASPAATINQTIGLTDVKIEYSRPAMRGRKIMGDLVPFGELWRTGANANTKISFSDPVTISGVTVPEGTYALYTRPGEEMWEVFIYKKSDNWALPKVWDANQIVVVSESEVFRSDEVIESFTIQIEDISNDSAVLSISWENTKVKTLIKVPTHEKTMASIDKTLSQNPGASDYYKSAVYYLNRGLDLNQAKSWMEIAVKKGNNKYFHLRQYSLILAAIGDKSAAIEVAKKSYELAEVAGNKDYLKMNSESIEEWSK